jgi:uncharacterized protein YjbJ (UPF0337 family)
MNTAVIKGNWKVIKGKLKQKYAQLTEDDLTYVEGLENELLGRLQKRTGQTRAEIETFLRDDCGCVFPPSTGPSADFDGDRPDLADDEPVRRNQAHRTG